MEQLNKEFYFKINDGNEINLNVGIIGPDGIESEVNLILDTGYNGFIQIPRDIGDIIGFKPYAVRSSRLADGTNKPTIETFGVVSFLDKKLSGFIGLQEGTYHGLIGMQLLNELRMDIKISLKNSAISFIRTE